MAPVPLSVNRSMTTWSEVKPNKLYPAASIHRRRSSRLDNVMGSTIFARNGSAPARTELPPPVGYTVFSREHINARSVSHRLIERRKFVGPLGPRLDQRIGIAQHVPSQAPVRLRARVGGHVRQDGLPQRGRLGEAHRPRHGAVAEHGRLSFEPL